MKWTGGQYKFFVSLFGGTSNMPVFCTVPCV